MATFKDRIKAVLIRDQILKAEDLELALEEQKKTGGELSGILIRLGMINEEQLAYLLSEGLSLPVLDIARMRLDPDVVSIIPPEVLRKYHILPVSRLGNNISLAMVDPLNIFVIDNVKALTGLTISPVIGRSRDIQEAIERYCAPRKEADSFAKIMQDIKGADDLELIRTVSTNLTAKRLSILSRRRR